MFNFHERIQRRFCRTGFFLLCVLPLFAVGIWAVRLHLPSWHRAVADRLSYRLGLQVTLQRVAYPRPGLERYESVVLGNARGGPPIASAERVDVAACRRTDGYQIQMHNVRIQAEGLDDVIRAFWNTVARQDRIFADAVIIDSLTIDRADPKLSQDAFWIQNLRIAPMPVDRDVPADATRQGLRIQGEVAGTGTVNRFQISLFHSRAPGIQPIRIEFHTGAAPIPCWSLASIFPLFNYVGREATCRGSGTLTKSAEEWTGEWRGTIQQVAFGQMAGILPIDPWTATGTIAIDRVRWSHGRLDQVQGIVRCGPGTIDHRWIDAAGRALFCSLPGENRYEGTVTGVRTNGQESEPGLRADPAERPDPPPAVPFDELAFRLLLDTDGLILWGACETAGPGTMIAHAGRPILGEPRYRRLPVANLVYLFVPPVQAHVPATREAQDIARRLPLPSDATRQ